MTSHTALRAAALAALVAVAIARGAAQGSAALGAAAGGGAQTPIPLTSPRSPSAAASSGAASTDAAPKALGLDEARELALASSPSLRKALLGVDSAKLASRSTSYGRLPSLSASAQAGLSYPWETSVLSAFKASLGLSASQTIYDGGRNAALAAINAIDESVAQRAAKSAYFAAVQELEQAFYSALKAEAARRAAESDLAASRIHLDLAKAKLEAGMIAKPAYLQVESAAAAKETALNSAEKAASVAARKLSALTGLGASTPLAGADEAATEALAARFASLPADGVEALADALVELASRANPDLSSAELAVERAEAVVESAKREALPKVSASWSQSASYSGKTGLDLASGSLSLGASIPIEPWGIKNSVATKAIAVAKAEIDRDEARSSNELDIRSAAYAAVADARAISSSKMALEYAERNYDSQLELFQLSSLSSSGLSDAEASVASARSALISARYGFLSGLSSIRAYAGLEDEAALEAAIPK